MSATSGTRANVLFMFNARAEKWVSSDSARAAIRGVLEEAVDRIEGWSRVGRVDFLGFDAVERSRYRSIRVTVGVPVDGPGFDNRSEGELALAQVVAFQAIRYLTDHLDIDELSVTEVPLAWAVVFRDGDEPLEVQLYQPKKPDAPGLRHLRAL
jgi:hypothetical protein